VWDLAVGRRELKPGWWALVAAWVWHGRYFCLRAGAVP